MEAIPVVAEVAQAPALAVLALEVSKWKVSRPAKELPALF
jgi:hypothetical protein